MRKTRTPLLTTLLMFILCTTILVGATTAYFTETVQVSGNVVQSGNLKAEMYWTENLVPGENNEIQWIDASKETADDKAIFSYEQWEPGFTAVRFLQIRNAGRLAFQYQLNVLPQGELIGKANLMDAIDVYYGPVPQQDAAAQPSLNVKDYANFRDFTEALGLERMGTLSQLNAHTREHTWGVMLPSVATPNAELPAGVTASTGAGEFCIVLHMQEDAGNEYQQCGIEKGFVLQLTATQYTYEKDSFGHDYDAEAVSMLPVYASPVTVTADITGKVSPEGKLTEAVTLSSGDVSAIVPAGAQITPGATSLTLRITPMALSGANLTLGQTEETASYDVHVEGIDPANTLPLTITMGEVLPTGLNMGNYSLHHVENGETVKMNYVASGALEKHNDFKYDPATGFVTVAMAQFSEVAVVAEPAKWEGEFDYSWYTNAAMALDGEAANEYIIANADQLAGFGAIVGGMNGQTQDSFKGKTVKLIADIDLGDKNNANESLIFHPIGYYYTDDKNADGTTGDYYSTVNSFEGTFDGNGHTITNFYHNTWEIKGDYDGNYYKDAMGLFGYVVNGKVCNLTVDNFSSDGEFTPTGVIAAYAVNSTFENIAITNCNPRVYNTGNGGIVGIGGNSDDPDAYKLTFTNITIDNTNTISALWGSWDVACGGLVGMFRGDGHVHMTNCHVAAQMDVNNDVCGNYQYYWYRYSGMMIGTNVNMTTDANGYTVPETDKFHANECTVHFGEWNDYYYCELVANSIASYTHDHQFSRLEQISSLDEIKSGDTWTKAGNFLLISGDTKTCYHIVKNGNTLKRHLHTDAGTETINGETVPVEDKTCVYLPFNQLFTGYGWGVKHIPVYNGEDYAFEGIKILDRVEAKSYTKFVTKFTKDFLYRVGNSNPVSIGSLFEATKEKDDKGNSITINSSGVWVTIEKLNKNMEVSGTYTANASDWTQGTIQFSGTGVVKVTIQDYNFCTPTVLYLEVVDAKNTTTASFSGNTVLLNDVSTSNTLSASGVIYGNGFTVNMQNAPISEKNGAVFHLYDGAVLKNIGIVGKEFTTVAMNVNDTNYGVSAVRAWGTVTIENSYISGCRAAVSATGTELTIKDSVIANGVYANIDFRSGILNLHNVTTVNEPHSVNGNTVVGLGIVGNMTASAGRQINITGALTQYNWVSQSDCENIKATGVNSIFTSVFTEDKYASLRYTYNNTTYVNTGILSLCSDFTSNAATGIPSNYNGMDVNATISSVTVNGYVWAPAQAGQLTETDMAYHADVYRWAANDQGTSYIPSAFNFSNAGLTAENGVVQIEYDSGSSYKLSANTMAALFSPEKYGQSLSYKVSMNDTDYTNKDIVFNGTASQTYTITYTITDNLVYDKNGSKTDKTYEVTKELKVFATVVDKGAYAPTFTFYYGTNGSASAGTPHTTQPTNSYTSTIKQIGETYYIMPNVSATTANAIGSQTVDGVTVYYPIVDGINVRSGNSTDYDFTRYYPIFKAVKISDNGTEYSYSDTKEMPATVAWVSATIDSGNGASALNDEFGLYNNQYLCKIQTKAGNDEAGGTSVVKYSYTALDGNTYYYYVGYRFYDEDEGGVCLTPSTLITLADGSQKRIDALTGDEKLLVWNHQTGALDTAPVAYIVNHDNEEKQQEVIQLSFDNGNDVEIIGEHVFFDVDLNKYVTLDHNAEQYIGHRFSILDGDGISAATLIKVEKNTLLTTAYEVVSYQHLTCFTGGLLSASAYMDKLLNIFDIDPATMGYIPEHVQQDIKTYGLYTYHDFDGLIGEDAFDLYNAAYLKIAVGKGYITWDDILSLIDIYFNVNVNPLQ